MIKGVEKLTAVVGCTLGPKGRNVVVQRRVGTRPRIINDGVSIAKEIHLEDDLEEIGAQLVLEASERYHLYKVFIRVKYGVKKRMGKEMLRLR